MTTNTKKSFRVARLETYKLLPHRVEDPVRLINVCFPLRLRVSSPVHYSAESNCRSNLLRCRLSPGAVPNRHIRAD